MSLTFMQMPCTHRKEVLVMPKVKVWKPASVRVFILPSLSGSYRVCWDPYKKRPPQIWVSEETARNPELFSEVYSEALDFLTERGLVGKLH